MDVPSVGRKERKDIPVEKFAAARTRLNLLHNFSPGKEEKRVKEEGTVDQVGRVGRRPVIQKPKQRFGE